MVSVVLFGLLVLLLLMLSFLLMLLYLSFLHFLLFVLISWQRFFLLLQNIYHMILIRLLILFLKYFARCHIAFFNSLVNAFS
jgi:hypothetical protein